jgi:hypothetical protein
MFGCRCILVSDYAERIGKHQDQFESVCGGLVDYMCEGTLSRVVLPTRLMLLLDAVAAGCRGIVKVAQAIDKIERLSLFANVNSFKVRNLHPEYGCRSARAKEKRACIQDMSEKGKKEKKKNQAAGPCSVR